MGLFIVVLMGGWLCWESHFGGQLLLPIGFTLIFILIQLIKINGTLNQYNDSQLIEKFYK